MSHLLPLCWHYVLCFVLLLLLFVFRKQHKCKDVIAIGCCMVLVSIVGFFVVYFGPFAQSGKTFFGYVTRYGIFTLPVLMFAVVGILFAVRWSKKN